MNITDKINEIDEYFANIPMDDFLEKLKKAGHGEIKSCEEYGVGLKEEK